MFVETAGNFTSAEWKEEALGDAEQYPRLAHASVSNTFTGGIEAADTRCAYAIAYVTEKTGTFAGMEVLTGTLDGRRGSFAVEQRGRFDEEFAVHCTFEVVPGSGSGDLAGLRGSGAFTARHGEPSVAYTFRYELG